MCSRISEIVASDSDLVPVVILLQVNLEGLGQLHVVHVAVVGQLVTDGGPAEHLQGEGVLPVDWVAQHRLEEHAGCGVLQREIMDFVL